MTDRNTQIILERIDRLEQRFMGLEKQFANLEGDLKAELKDANTRIETYQKSSTQLVGLAFGIINAVAIVIILAPLVKELAPYLIALIEALIQRVAK